MIILYFLGAGLTLSGYVLVILFFNALCRKYKIFVIRYSNLDDDNYYLALTWLWPVTMWIILPIIYYKKFIGGSKK